MQLVRTVLLCLTACTVNPWREQPPPWMPASIDGAADARIALAGGAILELRAPRIEQVNGQPILVGKFPATGGLVQESRIPIAAVQRLETRRTEFWPVVANVVFVTAAVVTLTAVGGPPLPWSSRRRRR